MKGIRKQTEERLIKQLESMPLEEARRKILQRQLGNDFDSPNHKFCLSWLEGKEAELRDKREEETLSISRKALSNSRLATRIAISAIVLSIIMAILKIIEWYQTS